MSSMREQARAVQPLNLSMRIAARVRELRLEQELTLEALAAQCEVSRSMLSLIERGESSATAVVLERIAVGLHVPLASLFDNPAAPENPLSRYEDQVPWQDPASGYIRRNVSPAIRSSPFKIVEVVLPANAKIAYESGARVAPLDQQVWVHEGDLQISLDKLTYRLKPGDCLAMQVKGPISFSNRSKKPTRYAVVIAIERATRSYGHY